MGPEKEEGQEVAGLRLNLDNHHCSGQRNWFPVALVVQESHHSVLAQEEGQQVVSTGSVQGDQEAAGIGRVVGRWEESTGSVVARREVGSLDSMAESLGTKTDY